MKNTPVRCAGWPRPRTVSSEPPRPKAITGVPQACASTGVMPKSSSAAKTKALARCMWSTSAASPRKPSTDTFGPATARTLSISGPSPMTMSFLSGMREKASAIIGMRLYGTMREAVR